MTVEYDNLTPLYDQVKRLILGDLKTGHYRNGTYLPSETDLCEYYQGQSNYSEKGGLGTLLRRVSEAGSWQGNARH